MSQKDNTEKYYVCVGEFNSDAEPCGWNSIDSENEPFETHIWVGAGAKVRMKVHKCPNCQGRAMSATMDEYWYKGVDPDKFIQESQNKF